MGRIFSQILAPKKRNPPKYQIEMAASVEELKETMKSMAIQFAGFHEMMTTTLDKLSALEAWQTTAEESLGTLLERSSATATRVKETASRVTRLEFRPPPQPPPSPPPH